jgi:ubiquinone/menaquinone biosynthesis C-methylase UbiE
MKTKPDLINTDKGQFKLNAAKVYEDFFVPAIFLEWTERIMEAAKINESQKVLDVACGTGVLARAISKRIGSAGEVIGLDSNNDMLRVASQIAPGIKWILGSAESLPFEDNKFDAVVSQFGLMFFTDRLKAIQEMMRVLKPNGNLAVAVWDSLDSNLGYASLVNLLQSHFGDNVADKLRAPFILGDKQKLLQIFEEAGVSSPSINTITGTARFPSIRSWVYTDVKGWTMSEMINDQQFDFLLNEADKELSFFLKSDGTISFDMPAHIVYAKKM